MLIDKNSYGYLLCRAFSIISGLGLFIFSTGCSSKSAHPEKPYRAEVLYFAPASDPTTSSGEWRIGEKTLQTLEDPNALKGIFFEILTGRTLMLDPLKRSLTSREISASTNASPLRYSLKNNVMIARDTNSLLLLSSFYSFEQVFEKIEPATGLQPSTFIQLIGGRYQVLFEPTVEGQYSGLGARYSLKMNAAFNANADNFIIFRRSNLENIPLAANLKVISHEFGHALFKRAFFAQKAENCASNNETEIAKNLSDKFFEGRFSIEYAISGFNEGYADFNSYVMTGSANPLEGSFTFGQLESRSLTGEPFYFSQLSSDQPCAGRFYCIGTLFARSLYRASIKYKENSDDLMAFSRRVYAAIESTPKFLREEPSASLLPVPNRDIASCRARNVISITYDGAISAAFLSAFLKGLPAGDEKVELCKYFNEFFGNDGFPKEARRVCDS